MKFYLIQFENGNNLKTGFNGDFNSAKKYYLGQKFELDESEPMVQCVGVVQIG